MKITQNKTDRIYSLDSLRAIMMLLGLVFHSAIPYVVTEYSKIKDTTASHISIDYILNFIHTFRMPIFFIVAGFFGAMLFYEKQPLQMIKNRISRLVYPFIVFLLVLWPVQVFTNSYTYLRFSGGDYAFTNTLSKLHKLDIFIPIETEHLWFLYYLILITFVSFVLGLVFNKLPALVSRQIQIFNWTIEKPVFRVLALACIMSIAHAIAGRAVILYSPYFKPDLHTFSLYYILYIWGWFLYQSKHHLDKLIRYDWLCSILGVILFTIGFLKYDLLFMSASYNYYMNIILNSISVSLFFFGFTGLFIRYGSNFSPTMRYLSDSSYWIYLIHVPITVFIPGLIYEWPLHATLKFTIVFITTTTVCFITYHYLVRATVIGKFLNGRKYPRKDTTGVQIRIVANNSKCKKSYLNELAIVIKESTI